MEKDGLEEYFKRTSIPLISFPVENGVVGGAA